MIEILDKWDKSLLLFLNGSDSLFLDGCMWSVTQTITWIPLFIALVYVISKNSNFQQTLSILILMTLLIIITDQFASSFCKPFFQRFRPTHDPQIMHLVDVVRGYRGGRYGFISSHAANTIGMATFLSLIFRNSGITLTLYSWAFLSSYSRVYLGVHYPGDILAGALSGIIAASLLFTIYTILKSKFAVQRKFYSSTYTPSGMLIADLNVVYATYACTICYVVLYGVFQALTM